MGMKVDLRVGVPLRFNEGQIVITLLEKSGQRARICVEADDSVSIQLPQRDQSEIHDDHEKMMTGAV